MQGTNAGAASYRSLLDRLRSRVRAYVAKQLLLPRQEIGELIAANVKAVALLAIAALLALLFVIELLAFAIAVLVLTGLWWIGLIVVLLLLAAAVVIGLVGKSRLVLRGPDRSIQSFKETLTWVKAKVLGRSAS